MNSKGFTLTELILAAAILAFALCGLLVLFLHCTFLNEGNRNLTLAVEHIQYVMEDIRNSSFSGLESAITNGVWDWTEADITANNLFPLPSEAINAEVFQSGDPLGVTVRVGWRDRGRRDRLAELQTLITDY